MIKTALFAGLAAIALTVGFSPEPAAGHGGFGCHGVMLAVHPAVVSVDCSATQVVAIRSCHGFAPRVRAWLHHRHEIRAARRAALLSCHAALVTDCAGS